MPHYDYRYTNAAGVVQTVERKFKMNEKPSSVWVVDKEDGKLYEAKTVILKPHARMANQWVVRGTDSTLPPENSRALSQRDVRPTE